MASEMSSMDIDGGSSTARSGAGAGAQQQPERPSWRPRLVAYAAASSSTTSGGSLSTTYTSGSSHLQSCSSGDGGLAPPVALLSTLELEEGREKTRRYIMCLVHEFAAAEDDEDAAAMVLQRWFLDLGIDWVLSIATDDDDKSPAGSLSFLFPWHLGDIARCWIDALTVIQLYTTTYFNVVLLKNQKEGALAASEYARFLGATLSKMLPFAEALVSAAKVNATCINHNLREAMVPAEEKLKIVIGVRQALYATSERITCWTIWPPIQGSRGILEQLSTSVSAKLAMLDEAVWDTVDKVRTSIVMPPKDSHNHSMDSEALELERAPAIHNTTRSIVNFINVMLSDYELLVRQIVSNAARLGKYVPEDNIFSHRPIADPLATLIMEMVSSLQENLARVYQPFPDQSLRFLFLLNNTHFMWQQLRRTSHPFPVYMRPVACKIDEHIQRYLQASWIPVVSGLHDPTPLCFGRYSPLAKFQTEFQKTYTAQKLWKVPDPELRTKLRKAIIETVIPVFTKYLEDNRIIAPRVTQQELEDMLQDLFEG
ncbi:unnamed protein product [Urochloa humidicola]